MPDTFTPYLGLCQPEVGGSIDTWGQKTNNDWSLLDEKAEAVDKKLSETTQRADLGVNNAALAQAAADKAEADAQKAQARADAAYDLAVNGGGEAGAAMKAAQAAQARADDAWTRANNAQTTANTANTTANTANTNATSALNQLANKVNKSGDTMTGNLTVQGQIAATQNVVAYASDARLKTDVKPLEGFEDRIMALNPVRFGWNEAGQKLVHRDADWRENGFIAQEVQEVNPQAVMQNPTIKLPDSEEHPLTVKKDEMMADLVAQVQSLTKRLRALEGGK